MATSNPSNSLDAVMSLMQLFNGGKTQTVNSGTTSTKQTAIDPNTLATLMQSVMGQTNGLAQLLNSQQTSGLYNSTVNQQLAGDFMSKLMAQVAAQNAVTTETKSGNTQTTKTPTPSKDTGTLIAALGLANNLLKDQGGILGVGKKLFGLGDKGGDTLSAINVSNEGAEALNSVPSVMYDAGQYGAGLDSALQSAGLPISSFTDFTGGISDFAADFVPDTSFLSDLDNLGDMTSAADIASNAADVADFMFANGGRVPVKKAKAAFANGGRVQQRAESIISTDGRQAEQTPDLGAILAEINSNGSGINLSGKADYVSKSDEANPFSIHNPNTTSLPGTWKVGNYNGDDLYLQLNSGLVNNNIATAGLNPKGQNWSWYVNVPEKGGVFKNSIMPMLNIASYFTGNLGGILLSDASQALSGSGSAGSGNSAEQYAKLLKLDKTAQANENPQNIKGYNSKLDIQAILPNGTLFDPTIGEDAYTGTDIAATAALQSSSSAYQFNTPSAGTGPSVAGSNYYANGGDIPGHDLNGKDNITIHVSGGEYVVPTDVVDVPGVEQFLDHIVSLYHKPLPEKS